MEQNQKKDNLIICMPSYNEEENIESVVRSWYEILSGKAEASELVVNMSGSKDRTGEILQRMQRELPKLSVICDSKNTYRDKVLDLYRYALKSGADYVFQTDSDGQTNPEEFDCFWEKRKEYDSVIGVRKQRGDGVSRMLVEQVVCLFAAVFCLTVVQDANAPFRLMSKSFLSDALAVIPPDYSMPNIMLTIYGAKKKKVLFKEISFKSRMKGKNKMNLKKIIATGWESIAALCTFYRKIRR